MTRRKKSPPSPERRASREAVNKKKGRNAEGARKDDDGKKKSMTTLIFGKMMSKSKNKRNASKEGEKTVAEVQTRTEASPPPVAQSPDFQIMSEFPLSMSDWSELEIVLKPEVQSKKAAKPRDAGSKQLSKEKKTPSRETTAEPRDAGSKQLSKEKKTPSRETSAETIQKMSKKEKKTQEKVSKMEEKVSKQEKKPEEKVSKAEKKPEEKMSKQEKKAEEKMSKQEKKAEEKMSKQEKKPEEKVSKQEKKQEEKVSKQEKKPKDKPLSMEKIPEDKPLKEEKKVEEKKEEKVEDKNEEKKEDKKDEKLEEKKEDKTLIALCEDDVLMGQKGIEWKVKCQLGRGGYGKVFKVYNDAIRGGTHLACKTEAKNEDVAQRTKLRLKIEYDTMLSIYRSAPNKTRHFAELIDSGKDAKRGLKYIVMTLLGPSLGDLRKTLYGGGDFPIETGIYVAQQTLEALQHLHEIGFIHRDVKPQNYAIGRGANETTIYLFDFGLSRRLYEDGKHRKPREDNKVKFCGTPRYASIRSHNRCEQSRRDDIESWLYMTYDLFDGEGGLRWKACKREEIATFAVKKRQFLKSGGCSPEEKQIYASSQVPEGFEEFKGLILKLTYEERPPYERFQEAISKEAILHEVAANKCEWIGKDAEDIMAKAKDDKKENSFDNIKQFSITL